MSVQFGLRDLLGNHIVGFLSHDARKLVIRVYDQVILPKKAFSLNFQIQQEEGYY